MEETNDDWAIAHNDNRLSILLRDNLDRNERARVADALRSIAVDIEAGTQPLRLQ